MWSRLASRFENPVLSKEMRTRMRGTRAYGVMLVYVGILAVAMLLVYAAWYNQYAANTYRPIPGSPPLGRLLFQTLFTAQAVMILLITPALTAGMITLEREQRTFELLMLTMLRPREVVVGKLASAFGFSVLLLTISLPLAGICLMLGGVSPQEIAVVYLLMGASALFYATIGMIFSAMLQSTALATAGAYLATLLCTLVTGMAGGGGREILFSSVNPVAAIWNALEAAPFYGWQAPTWIAALLVNGLAALLAAAASIHHLEEGVSENPGLLRWLSLLLFAVMAFGISGNALGGAVPYLYSKTGGSYGSPSELRAMVCTLSGVLMLSLVILTLVFCTGRRADALGAPARKPRRSGLRAQLLDAPLFAGGYAWGPAYVLLLFLTGSVALLAGLVWGRNPMWIVGLEAAGAGLAVALATLFCTVAMARLCTLLLDHRPAAMLVPLVILGALWLIPLFSYIDWDPSLRQHSLFWETLYLNPVIALMAVALDPGEWRDAVPTLWAGQGLAWVCNIGISLALSAAMEILGQTVLTVRKRRARQARKAA